MNTIYTLGYGGGAWTPDALAQVVKEKGARLVDIRYSPRSRVPHWNAGPLEKSLGNQSYMHLPALGNVNYKNGGPIELANPAHAVDVLRPILLKQSIILLCACRDAATCHRTPAAEYLAEQLGAEVVHIEGRSVEVACIAPPKLEQLSLF